jgi:MarR family transcriptional regulator, temperature-dependent positive regulator of motility
MNEDAHYRVLRVIEDSPKITQRKLAEKLGISLGKTNYCINAMVNQGWIKATNFKNGNRKIAHAYLLTPTGMGEKARMAVRFLRRKVEEYEALKLEIDELLADTRSNQ